jgi:hypothetical protein
MKSNHLQETLDETQAHRMLFLPLRVNFLGTCKWLITSRLFSSTKLKVPLIPSGSLLKKQKCGL